MKNSLRFNPKPEWNNNNNQNSSYSLFPKTFQSFIPEIPASFSENNTESILDVNDRIIEQKKDKEIINKLSYSKK